MWKSLKKSLNVWNKFFLYNKQCMLILLNTYFFYSNAFLTLGLLTRKYSFFRDNIFSASVILPLLSGGYIKGIRNTLCTFSTPSPSQSLLDLFLNGSPSSFTWKDKMEKDMSKHREGKKNSIKKTPKWNCTPQLPPWDETQGPLYSHSN